MSPQISAVTMAQSERTIGKPVGTKSKTTSEKAVSVSSEKPTSNKSGTLSKLEKVNVALNASNKPERTEKTSVSRPERMSTSEKIIIIEKPSTEATSKGTNSFASERSSKSSGSLKEERNLKWIDYLDLTTTFKSEIQNVH